MVMLRRFDLANFTSLKSTPSKVLSVAFFSAAGEEPVAEVPEARDHRELADPQAVAGELQPDRRHVAVDVDADKHGAGLLVLLRLGAGDPGERQADVGLQHGVALPVWHALASGEHADLSVLAQKAAAGGVRFALPEGRAATRASAGESVGVNTE